MRDNAVVNAIEVTGFACMQCGFITNYCFVLQYHGWMQLHDRRHVSKNT